MNSDDPRKLTLNSTNLKDLVWLMQLARDHCDLAHDFSWAQRARHYELLFAEAAVPKGNFMTEFEERIVGALERIAASLEGKMRPGGLTIHDQLSDIIFWYGKFADKLGPGDTPDSSTIIDTLINIEERLKDD